MEEKREQFFATEIRSLEVEIETAELIVEMSETEETLCAEVCLSPDDVYESSLCDSTLTISLGHRLGRKILRTNLDLPKLKLILPPGLQLENFSLEIGAGNADMCQAAIKCRSFYLKTGAGNARIGRLNIKETLKTEIGAGKVKLDRIRAKNAEINCGVGDFYMNGSIGCDLNVDCGIGKCTILLNGKQSDYSYDISCGIGKVCINGQSAGQIGSRYIENRSASGQYNENQNSDRPHQEQQYDDFTKNTPGKIKISCGVGNVTVKTTEV